jgi:carnosine N-methyltransferase
LWHFENNAPGHHGLDDDGDGLHDSKNSSSGIADPGSFELADDEVISLLGQLGFQVEWRKTGVDAPYIQDSASMLQTVYRASAWLARKPDLLSASVIGSGARKGLGVDVDAAPATQT